MMYNNKLLNEKFTIIVKNINIIFWLKSQLDVFTKSKIC